ncbi:MAG: DUF3095 domain-containing protein [Rhodocyclales bacterium]|nr:DUF3095 domain-containing protein [Rhodocyclales bacterium]
MPAPLLDTRNFYRDLAPLPEFADAPDSRQHVSLPADWWVLVADIAGSTAAIESGHYKNVNSVGVACIAAVLNIDRERDIPFIFGGDGATFAFPADLLERVRCAMRGVQRMASQSFGLELRAGLIRADTLLQGGLRLQVAKIQLSAHVTQAAFSGRGWDEAERRLKAREQQNIELIDEKNEPAEADFSGFECRWQAVPNFNGHKLALLIAAISHDPEENLATYRQVTQQLQHIYGELPDYHPLRAAALNLALSPAELQNEWRVRNQQRPWSQRLAYLARMIFQNLAGRYLFKRRQDTASVRWSHYRDELVENTDFRKFDGVLRMVIDGSDTQAAALSEFLAQQQSAGKLAYGMHKSPAALLTCLVQSYNGKHLHFVDGSAGGYALAARQLKRQLAERKAQA